MTKKNTRNVARLIESIERHALRQVPSDPSKPAGRRRPQLAASLAAARDVLAAMSGPGSRRDGFPSSTAGDGSPGAGKGGGVVMPVRDVDAGTVDRLPSSSTELAALDTSRPDAVETIARDLLSELEQIERSLVRVQSLLDRFDRLRHPDRTGEGRPQCFVASVLHRMPWDETWTPFVSTTFAGVLEHPFPEERPVCRWVYDFTRRHERLPDQRELGEYLARGTVRVAAS